MPTILRKRGYRFFFYMADEFEPPHIHVEKAGKAAKFWLQPIALSRNEGFREHELNQIYDIITENHALLLAKWQDQFGVR